MNEEISNAVLTGNVYDIAESSKSNWEPARRRWPAWMP